MLQPLQPLRLRIKSLFLPLALPPLRRKLLLECLKLFGLLLKLLRLLLA